MSYLIYRVGRDSELNLIAETPTKEGVGTAIVTLAEEGEFQDCALGVLHRPFDDKPGSWLINPFTRSGDRAAGAKSRKSESKVKSKRRKK